MGFSGDSVVKNLPAMQKLRETWIRSLGWEDLLKEEMATHSHNLARIIPWTEKLGGLCPWGHKESVPNMLNKILANRFQFHFMKTIHCDQDNLFHECKLGSILGNSSI